jgi:hypothetical protein
MSLNKQEHNIPSYEDNIPSYEDRPYILDSTPYEEMCFCYVGIVNVTFLFFIYI